MRSRAQEIAIILSRYKKRAATSRRTFNALTPDEARDAAIKRIADRKADMATRRPQNAAELDLARVQKRDPSAKLVDEITGASIVYPDGSIMEVAAHDKFHSAPLNDWGDAIKSSALGDAFREHKAVQARLWSGGQLAIQIRTEKITPMQAQAIMRAAKSAKDTTWEVRDPITGKNTTNQGVSINPGDVRAAIEPLIGGATSFSMLTPKAGLRNVINKLKAQGHRASDFRTVFRSQPSAFDDVVKKSGFMPREWDDAAKGTQYQVFTGSRRIAQAHGKLMRTGTNSKRPQSLYKARVLKKGLIKKAIYYDSATVPVVRGHEYRSKKQIPASQIRLVSKDKPKRQRKGWR